MEGAPQERSGKLYKPRAAGAQVPFAVHSCGSNAPRARIRFG